MRVGISQERENTRQWDMPRVCLGWRNGDEAAWGSTAVCAASYKSAGIHHPYVLPNTPSRVRKDHYKGMSEAERQAILATQMAQVEEKRARQAAQAAEDAAYARTQADILRAMDAQVRAGAAECVYGRG